ncbi:SPW repeat protein [Dactylosporangium aurantiacum]|uniref:SPW repeat protein n=1 Tax=Dactylosporangium aurantiacum TaxID=35754 RepID=A0A9Q9IP71_9ACTN|nr:SPW repeat protein [Dactylosporangium aurantiacum]MDG6110524.1 SPW repeat protein [Dactylosporangium aurantiacum]UWZ58638.1 SPW repeat protein [Dactylosporangium aurantiacum]
MADVAQFLTTHPDLADLEDRAARITASAQSVAIDGLVLLTGGWLAISPWVVHFNAIAPNLTVNNLILGILVTVVALGLTMAPARMYRLSWSMVAIGAWVIIAPFAIQQSASSAGLIWNNAVTGGAVVLLGLAAVGLLMRTGRGHRDARR